MAPRVLLERKVMKARTRWILNGALLGVCWAAGANAATPAGCQVRLAVQLTPDAAVPRNPGFLSSLVADPQYELRWIQGTDTAAILELRGPDSDDQCSDGINMLQRSSHVLNVEVVTPDNTDELTPLT
jgi:hypothetical protein